MTSQVDVSQDVFEAIMDRLEKGPMNMTGMHWRDDPNDPALTELREHFIVPVIEEWTRLTAEQANAAEIERLTALLREARTGLSVLMDTAADFTETDRENISQAATLVGRIDAILNKKDARHD